MSASRERVTSVTQILNNLCVESWELVVVDADGNTDAWSVPHKIADGEMLAAAHFLDPAKERECLLATEE
jgi:hypothetical protein